MALMQCRECGEDVRALERACPHCGALSPASMEIKKKHVGIGCGTLLVLFVLALIFIPGESPEERAARNKARAAREAVEKAEQAADEAKTTVAVLCQESMKSGLRSPSTAKFPWDQPNQVVLSGDTAATLVSYVDAQNAFGAEVRTDFRCVAERNADGWTARAELVSR